MERKRLKTDQLRIEREKYYSDLGQGNYDATKFKTKFGQRYEEEEKLKKQIEQKQIEALHQRSEKMRVYAKMVKETKWPDVSEKKKQELKRLKKELSQRNKRIRSPHMVKS